MVGTVLRLAGRRYVAGRAPEDAARVIEHERAAGCRVTVCFWDGGTEPPERVAEAAHASLPLLVPGDRLSIKGRPLAFGHELVASIAVAAHGADVELHVDALWPEDADASLALPADGFTVPARWRRSRNDAARIERVRIVKGQWRDPREDVEPREGFLALVDAVAGRAELVSIATHDAPLAREALARLHATGTKCELELLLGLPRPAVDGAVRIYVPWGTARPPYANRPALRSPRTYARLCRDLLLGGRSS